MKKKRSPSANSDCPTDSIGPITTGFLAIHTIQCPKDHGASTAPGGRGRSHSEMRSIS